MKSIWWSLLASLFAGALLVAPAFGQQTPVLESSVLSPAWRNTIQSHDPNKDLYLTGTVKAGTLPSGVLVSLSCDGKSKWKKWARVKTDGSFSFRTSLAGLPAGEYTVRVYLENGSAANQHALHILPPAKTEVTFDERRVCYVNGQPFFPIGLYHVSPAAVEGVNRKSRAAGLPEIGLFESIKQVKDAGFNVIHHTWGMPDESYLAFTEKIGMYVIPEVAAPTAEQVALANRHSNVLMWYGSDEPAGEVLKQIQRDRIQTAKLDPHRPVSAAVCNPDLFKSALEGFDFVMMDPYVIRYRPLTDIADWMKRGMDAGEGRKPVWLVPQAFTIDSSSWQEPTPEEIRCEAYIGLVHGATGFIWYAFWTSENWAGNPKGRNTWLLTDSKLWDAFPKLNAEVAELAPIVLMGENRGPVHCSSPGVHTCLWRYKGKSYLLTVNTQYLTVVCTIDGIARNAEVMFENRQVSTKHGVLNESFKPLEAHVYRF